MSIDIEKEEAVFLTHSELTNLNRLFGILGEQQLKANWFTKADIESVYSVLEKTRIALDEISLNNGHS